jgi:hypothetical protein
MSMRGTVKCEPFSVDEFLDGPNEKCVIMLDVHSVTIVDGAKKILSVTLLFIIQKFSLLCSVSTTGVGPQNGGISLVLTFALMKL